MTRILRTVLAAVLAFAFAASTLAQTPRAAPGGGSAIRYPAKPIRLISPFAPGGGASTIARMIAPGLSEAWGQPVVVDNRPGAGGAIGTEIVARAQPDGYTLAMATASTIAIHPLVAKVPFDPIKDFTPVVHTSTVPLVLAVFPGVPARSVKELVDYSRATRLNFCSSGEGTISHLAGELFKNVAKFNMVHVPYKGGGQAVIDLMAGHVQVGFLNILEALPQINAGRLRGLAVSTRKRSPVAPNIPTMAESGLPGYEVIQWSGILGPAGVPRKRVGKLNGEINRILAEPEIRERLMKAGAEPGSGSAEQFAALIRSEISKWSGVVKSVNLNIRR